MRPGADFGLCSVQATPRGWVRSEEHQMCPTLFHPYMLLTASSPHCQSRFHWGPAAVKQSHTTLHTLPGAQCLPPGTTGCESRGVDGPRHAGRIPSVSALMSLMPLSCLLMSAVCMPLVALSWWEMVLVTLSTLRSWVLGPSNALLLCVIHVLWCRWVWGWAYGSTEFASSHLFLPSQALSNQDATNKPLSCKCLYDCFM